MVEPEPSAEFAVQDLSLDRDGRVRITNAAMAGRLHAAAVTPKPKPKPNTNCKGCNNVKGCGGSNVDCTPNTAPQCGCIVKPVKR
jgi:hypothetical protein